MADTNKPQPADYSHEAQIKPASHFKAIFPYLAIIICGVVAFSIFYGVFGQAENFKGGPAAKEKYMEWKAAGADPDSEPAHWTDGEPAKDNLMGLIYKGGFVIPIGMTITLVILVFFIERLITLIRASGRGNTDVFVKKIRTMLANGEITEAAMRGELDFFGSLKSRVALLKGAEDERIRSVTAWAPIHDLKERWPWEVLEQWAKDGVYYVQNKRTQQEMPLKYSLVEDVLNKEYRLNIPEAV